MYRSMSLSSQTVPPPPPTLSRDVGDLVAGLGSFGFTHVHKQSVLKMGLRIKPVGPVTSKSSNLGIIGISLA